MNYFLYCLKNYATFSGRATRSEYWYFTLISVLISIIITIFDGMIGTYDDVSGFGMFSSIFSLALFIPSLAVLVRRLHDTNRSGWWFFIVLIPIIGIIVLIVFLCLDSKEDNKYGINQKKNSSFFNNNSFSELEKLSELKDKGILTQEEFENKKRYLLDENNNNNNEMDWLRIPSFIFGLLAFLASFDESEWNMDETIGVLFFISIAFILGFISISIQNNGKALSIAGIVLSILASLAILDRFEYINLFPLR